MTIKQSLNAAGFKSVAFNPVAGATQTMAYEIDLNEVAVATSDILEIGALPAYSQVASIEVFGENLPATNVATVGVMSGDWGDTDPTRTSGAEFASANINNAIAASTAIKCAAVTAAIGQRSIGVKLGTALAATANAKITMVVQTFVAVVPNA